MWHSTGVFTEQCQKSAKATAAAAVCRGECLAFGGHTPTNQPIHICDGGGGSGKEVTSSPAASYPNPIRTDPPHAPPPSYPPPNLILPSPSSR
ncbi:hypothetical protein Pcinc_026354 [Petrolisthes cinctipes]|uniref:Uncharacterized protein n=1 Tax=Petrolisthes cinctipes TaxID=88211 RepID=A0AAE1F6N3_PETCI|nr:hypothetical protein Pcinc_026354 [Petrolisthes cinctipes]